MGTTFIVWFWGSYDGEPMACWEFQTLAAAESFKYEQAKPFEYHIF